MESQRFRIIFNRRDKRVYLEVVGKTAQKQNAHKIVTTDLHFNTWREFVPTGGFETKLFFFIKLTNG